MIQGYEPWEVQTFTGTRKQVVRLVPLRGQFLLIFQTTSNAGYIGVEGVNQNGQVTMLAVNATEQYNGTTWWTEQGDPIVALKVECAGGWSLAIRPLSDARVWEGADATGTGPDVLVLDQPVSGFTTIAIHATSVGYTGVSAYGNSDSYLLFNFVGPSQEETVLPPGVWIVTIDSHAPWSMARG